MLVVLLLHSAATVLSASVPPNQGFPPSLKPGCLPADRQQDLYCPGQYDYGCFKIPTLLRVPNTTRLLGFIEARKFSCDDHGYVDILVRVSDNLGQTWGQPAFVYGDSTATDWHTIGDALPIYDRDTSDVHLIFTRDNAEVFYTRSHDAARVGTDSPTWDPPRDISASAVSKKGHGFIGTGHANGLQLRNGTLLAPLYGGGVSSFVLRSDTHGRSWRISGVLDAAPNEWVMQVLPHQGEPHLIGSLRSFPQRRQAYSSDNGASWTPTVEVAGLPEPLEGCEASLLAHPNGALYYAHPNPSAHLFRETMDIKVSRDGGKSWKQHVQVWGATAGCAPPCVPAASYSSMALLGDESDEDDVHSPIGLFYMRNNISMVVFEGTASFATFLP